MVNLNPGAYHGVREVMHNAGARSPLLKPRLLTVEKSQTGCVVDSVVCPPGI